MEMEQRWLITEKNKRFHNLFFNPEIKTLLRNYAYDALIVLDLLAYMIQSVIQFVPYLVRIFCYKSETETYYQIYK